MTNIIRKSINNLVVGCLNKQQIRFYSRWSHRKPSKVLTQEEFDDLEKKSANPISKNEAETDKNLENKYETSKIDFNRSRLVEKGVEEALKYKIKPKFKPLTTSSASQNKKKVQVDMLETVITENGEFIYTKMANNDHRVGILLTEVKSKKEKEKKGLVLLEGKRLIRDALLSGCQLKYIIFSRKTDLDDIRDVLPKFGAQLYKMPYNEMQMWSDLTTNPGIMGIIKMPNVEIFESPNPLPITIICENIREPGNLGAILRTCAGVGCEKVILTKGCVNLWDSKVLRGASGAHFKLQIHKNVNWEEIGHLIKPNSSVFLADNRIISNFNENLQVEEISSLEETVRKMPLVPYYGINYKDFEHVVLLIGGETYGISDKSYNFAAESNGARINIPLDNKVDSLNVGAALGIIAFEIKRQFAKV